MTLQHSSPHTIQEAASNDHRECPPVGKAAPRARRRATAHLPEQSPSVGRPSLLLAIGHTEIAVELAFSLREENLDVVIAHKSEQVERFLLREQFDLIVFDIELPDTNGAALAARLQRDFGPRVVILATHPALDLQSTHLARVSKFIEQLFEFHPAELPAPHDRDPQNHSMQRSRWHFLCAEGQLINPRGVRLKLTQKESELLQLLHGLPDHVASRNQIYKALWGQDSQADTRRLEVLIHRMRGRLDATFGSMNQPLHTLRGVGYRFVAPLDMQ